ncbi:aspartic peptidase domain-containing protein [Mycena rosella]|uniref:Aspartic peptidase domain-containing protein n=1 Tax=Mycena rosella TaxID=1033263 RepID=A0AAD7G455_MYCRO|nr:aspartic peptidase domain-containing protein [Mycena rosella]
MPQIRLLLVTLLHLLYFAAALAIEERATPGSFSLPISRASEKYQAGKRSITSSVSGTHAHGDILVDITFGSQTLPILFDTGSTLLWVTSTYYTGSLSGDFYYNISASTTWAQIPGYTYSIHYVSGSNSTGVVGTDNVSMGGITVPGTVLGAANSGTPSTAVAGFIGMPRGSMSVKNSAGTTINKNTFMQNIASSLPTPIFAVYLPWGSGAAASSIDFGYIDSSKYTGTLSTVPLISGTFAWAFTSTSYYVNGVKHSVTSTTNGKAIIDTGTTVLRVYPEIASTFYAGVTGAYQDGTIWVFPCSTTTFPSLTLDVGGVQAPVSYEINFGFYTTLPNGTRICGGGIQVETSSEMIFGEVFLASNYVVFNDAASTIQIANIVF